MYTKKRFVAKHLGTFFYKKSVAELATPSTCQLFKYRKLQITMPLTA